MLFGMLMLTECRYFEEKHCLIKVCLLSLISVNYCNPWVTVGPTDEDHSQKNPLLLESHHIFATL